MGKTWRFETDVMRGRGLWAAHGATILSAVTINSKPQAPLAPASTQASVPNVGSVQVKASASVRAHVDPSVIVELCHLLLSGQYGMIRAQRKDLNRAALRWGGRIIGEYDVDRLDDITRSRVVVEYNMDDNVCEVRFDNERSTI